jgi:hypothetical protein
MIQAIENDKRERVVTCCRYYPGMLFAGLRKNMQTISHDTGYTDRN